MARKKKTEAVEEVEEGLGSVESHMAGGWPEAEAPEGHENMYPPPKLKREKGPTLSFEERQAIRIAHHEAMAKKQRDELETRAQERLTRQARQAIRESSKIHDLYIRLVAMPSEALAAAAIGFAALPMVTGETEARKAYALALLRAHIDWIEAQEEPSSPEGEEPPPEKALKTPEPDPLRDILVGGC